ncbi:MAG: hypothetical protein CMJ18_24375 [Phycisphaeraceae bacterium]|nr:hypothetical protein [Phycisphaeraceae bacterium]
MKFAHTRLCITPPVGTGLCGYAGRPKSQGITDDLDLQALLLEDDGGRRLLLICADLIGFESDFVARMKRWIGRQDDRLAPAHINFNASHTHGAPATARLTSVDGQRFPNDYTPFLRSRIKEAVTNVLEAPLQTGTLHAGIGRCRLGVNRRLPQRVGKRGAATTEFVMKPNYDGSTDSALGVLRIRGRSGDVLLVNYACHPTATGSTYAFTADFPGFAARALRAAAGQKREVMFLQGAGGDIRVPCVTDDGKSFKPAEPHEVARFGQMVADAVERTMKRKLTRLHPAFRATGGRVLYPYDKTREPDSVPFSLYPEIRDWRLAHEHRDGTPLDWTIWRFSKQCRVVALPGEICHMIGKRAKRKSAAQFPFFLGYTNGCPGYIPTDRIIDEGGYEGFRSIGVYGHAHPFEKGAEKLLMASLDEGLRDNG